MVMNALKKTVLHGWHRENGGKMGMFGEWDMPLSYGSEIKEYWAVREKAGLFDVSHMGVIVVDGEDAEKFVRYASTNDTGRMNVGDVQYALLCNEAGGILDDVTVYKNWHTNFFFVINAGNVGKIQNWFHDIRIRKKFSVRIETSKDHAILAIQGPSAEEIISKIIAREFLPQKRYTFTYVPLRDSVFISRTGYTGEDGFEIICTKRLARGFWTDFLGAGKNSGLLPCGLVARDMLRTEAGMRLYGNDIDETINPIEAGLERFVSFSKGDFIGKNRIEKALDLKHRSMGRCFHGFMVGKNISPKHGCHIFTDKLKECGVVTSATYSPSLKKRILLGYIRGKIKPEDPVFIEIGKEYFITTIAALPFYSSKR